jgi:two-component system, chemotaxis family, sensor kinase CheA
MSDFAGNEELLQDFLLEAGELLSSVDNMLVALEKDPADKALLNNIFRGFHTIKGGAGFLNATNLVTLCHRTENLFDKLRNDQIALSAELLDVILAATGEVRTMFESLERQSMPACAPADMLQVLEQAANGQLPEAQAATVAPASMPKAAPGVGGTGSAAEARDAIDWAALHAALLGGSTNTTTTTQVTAQVSTQVSAPNAASQAPSKTNEEPARANAGRRATDDPNANFAKAGRRDTDRVAVKETTIRVDTERLDQVLNLSGEIGLTKNRLVCLRSDLLQGKDSAASLRALDEAVSQLDLLVGDLQNAVMKTRMQPVGRLFQKYPRMARDVARQLGKDVELEISGEETELDRTMIDELSDPLVHLVRNAVDHGIETPEERLAAGKPAKSVVRLSAEQVGDRIILEISDDGRGMRADVLRRKALEKGLIDLETANSMDDKQSLHLIFLPGFSTKDKISDVSGRGVGMDVVKTNIQKLNGRIEIVSAPGQGTTISIVLPLTLAILPVLVVRLGDQPFALPLSMVREMIPIEAERIQAVNGRATMNLRNEVLPVTTLAELLEWPIESKPKFGVLLQAAARSLVLAVDGFVGRDEVVIKPLQGVKPKGIAGATMNGDGSVVLVLDMEALLATARFSTKADLFAEGGKSASAA